MKTRSIQFLRHRRLISKTLAPFFLSALLTLAGCQGDKENFVTLTGKAVFPTAFRTVLGEAVPVANKELRVLDLQRPADDNVAAISATDSKGEFNVTIPPTPAAAVIVLGDVRVAGIVDTRNGSASKNFNGSTDIACQAGITAVTEGALNARDLTAQRIANLEQAATLVQTQMTVDFTDKDGSLTAAANRVRLITNDGDHPA